MHETKDARGTDGQQVIGTIPTRARRLSTTLAGAATLAAKPKGKGKTRTASKALGGEGRHKIKLKKLQRGKTYKLALSVASADDQEATDSAKLKVNKE